MDDEMQTNNDNNTDHADQILATTLRSYIDAEDSQMTDAHAQDFGETPVSYSTPALTTTYLNAPYYTYPEYAQIGQEADAAEAFDFLEQHVSSTPPPALSEGNGGYDSDDELESESDYLFFNEDGTRASFDQWVKRKKKQHAPMSAEQQECKLLTIH